MTFSNWRPPVRFLVVVSLVLAAVWGLAVYAERILILRSVVPLSGTRLGVWVADFMQAVAAGVWGSGGGALIWYIVTRWAIPVSNWRNAGRRFLWIGIGVLTVVVCTVYGFYYVPYAEAGGPIAYSLFFVNSAVIYYFTTVFASPPSYKYTPVGSQSLRVF